MVVRSLSQSSLNKLTDKPSNKMNRNRQSPSSPSQKPPTRSRSMNGLRNTSPSKVNGGSIKSRGSSRGNDHFDYAETIATRSSDSAPSTPEDNINVVVRETLEAYGVTPYVFTKNVYEYVFYSLIKTRIF